MLSYFHERPVLQGIESVHQSFQVELHDLSGKTAFNLEQFSWFSKVTCIHFYLGAYAFGHIFRARDDF